MDSYVVVWSAHAARHAEANTEPTPCTCTRLRARSLTHQCLRLKRMNAAEATAKTNSPAPRTEPSEESTTDFERFREERCRRTSRVILPKSITAPKASAKASENSPLTTFPSLLASMVSKISSEMASDSFSNPCIKRSRSCFNLPEAAWTRACTLACRAMFIPPPWCIPIGPYASDSIHSFKFSAAGSMALWTICGIFWWMAERRLETTLRISPFCNEPSRFASNFAQVSSSCVCEKRSTERWRSLANLVINISSAKSRPLESLT
mmetsp:Transcript_2551/g.5151  ORF Transcript_2551/g.5151 Transcript_2551/m.5151 type:complete len:265 (-) Transcript_2551:213-1007(-)